VAKPEGVARQLDPVRVREKKNTDSDALLYCAIKEQRIAGKDCEREVPAGKKTMNPHLPEEIEGEERTRDRRRKGNATMANKENAGGDS